MGSRFLCGNFRLKLIVIKNVLFSVFKQKYFIYKSIDIELIKIL